jgi:hypothetical protein
MKAGTTHWGASGFGFLPNLRASTMLFVVATPSEAGGPGAIRYGRSTEVWVERLVREIASLVEGRDQQRRDRRVLTTPKIGWSSGP